MKSIQKSRPVKKGCYNVIIDHMTNCATQAFCGSQMSFVPVSFKHIILQFSIHLSKNSYS